MKINQKENENRKENENKLSPLLSSLTFGVYCPMQLWSGYHYIGH